MEILMTTNKIYDQLQEIAAHPGKNDKIALLREFIKDESFRDVMYSTLNPHIRFGVIPEYSWVCAGDKEFSDSTAKLLDDLILRNLTGNAAIDAIKNELSVLTEKSGSLLVSILKKDPRAGFGTTSVNKVWPNLIPEYAYMRCSLAKDKGVKLDKFNWTRGVYSQLKLDGMYLNMNLETASQDLLSRAGSQFPTEPFKFITDTVAHLSDLQTHGEMIVIEDGKVLPRKTGNGILNHVAEGGSFKENQQPKYIVWDVIPLKEAKKKNTYKKPYHERLKQLHDLFDSNPYIDVVEYRIVHSYADCVKHALELIKAGQEGSVFKDPDMFWEDGTSRWQVKAKVDFDVDLEIVEVRNGTEGTKNEGLPASFLCQSSDGLLKVGITVKNEKMRGIINQDRDAWIGQIVTVLANDIMYSDNEKKAHSLFLPRLDSDKARTDKFTADSFERIVAIHQSVINGLSRPE